MNVILLSGGSGKRLWPLSNDVRSKQFIHLFKGINGEKESMLQRVYRQIKTVDENSKIIVATSKTQVSAIKNQLGNKVSVCAEPCRKNTFPAIALAASYLHDEIGIDKDECVVVCPVDPYVDNSYYEAVLKLEELVKKSNANITLMGITPTYPSDKYGYIIPKDSGEVCIVREFKEKPDIETAKKYLEQGAMWNAGIFAFKLGYIIEKSHQFMDFIDYNDLYNKYQDLNSISFDYAVVENEPNIQVMRYSGEWRDVGTWNMMTEVMSDNIVGNALMDKTCQNSHVINELDIPVLCMGCKDMIVAVSCDGILVSDKNQSDYMKPYVEKISDNVRYIEKSWGTYTVIDIQPGSMTIKNRVSAGRSMTYHSHEIKREIWTIISGVGKVILDGEEKQVCAGDVFDIPVNCKHTVIAITDLDIIETQIGQEISHKDKIVHKISIK